MERRELVREEVIWSGPCCIKLESKSNLSQIKLKYQTYLKFDLKSRCIKVAEIKLKLGLIWGH